MSTEEKVYHFELLHTQEEIQQLVDRLRQEKLISFDTEFIRETTFYPQLELIQVATRSESWLVDARPAQMNRAALDALKPLIELFEDPSILKILHAAQGDQECIYTAFGTTAKGTFDTAVGAALCGYGDGIGLGSLLKTVIGVTIKKGHARTNWAQRPLPNHLCEYALGDVAYLVDVAEKLMNELRTRDRLDWALELCGEYEDGNQFEVSPEEIAIRLYRSGKVHPKDFGILHRLVQWRETRVRELNIPRKWLAADSILLDLTRVQPTTDDHLKTFRGINRGEMKNSGPSIFRAILEGQKEPRDQAPELHRNPPPSKNESQVMDLLKCYLGILADQSELASRHLMQSDQILRLLRSEIRTVEDLISENYLAPTAAKLVGRQLLEFLSGKTGLSIAEKSVKIQQLQK